MTLGGTDLYPCDRGIPNAYSRGYHHFQATEHGVCCIYCGALPRGSSQPTTYVTFQGDAS